MCDTNWINKMEKNLIDENDDDETQNIIKELIQNSAQIYNEDKLHDDTTKNKTHQMSDEELEDIVRNTVEKCINDEDYNSDKPQRNDVNNYYMRLIMRKMKDLIIQNKMLLELCQNINKDIRELKNKK